MNFCLRCGEAKPLRIVCPSCSTTFALDSGALFCGNCGTKLQQKAVVRYESDGFATPEKAVLCYLEGLKNQDLEQMLSAFAWETQLEHYSYDQYYEYYPAYGPGVTARIPSMEGIMYSANLHGLRNRQFSAIYNALEVCIRGPVDGSVNYKTKLLANEESAAEFFQSFDYIRLGKLSGLTNIRFLSPDEATDGRFSEERMQKSFQRINAQYGADEVVNLLAMADVGSETLYFAPTIARYADRWYLVTCSSTVSTIIGIPSPAQAFYLTTDALSDLSR